MKWEKRHPKPKVRIIPLKKIKINKKRPIVVLILKSFRFNKCINEVSKNKQGNNCPGYIPNIAAHIQGFRC
jgi:hypothetical protein